LSTQVALRAHPVFGISSVKYKGVQRNRLKAKLAAGGTVRFDKTGCCQQLYGRESSAGQSKRTVNQTLEVAAQSGVPMLSRGDGT